MNAPYGFPIGFPGAAMQEFPPSGMAPMDSAVAPIVRTAPGLPGYRGWSGYGATGMNPYGNPYHGAFSRDAAKQCAKFQSKLADAEAGKGFLPNGLFGNRIDNLRGDVEKWCGMAEAEADAAKKMDREYRRAVEEGDEATKAAIEEAIAQQQAADSQTQYAAVGAVGIATLGLLGVILWTSRGGARR